MTTETSLKTILWLDYYTNVDKDNITIAIIYHCVIKNILNTFFFIFTKNII